MKHRIDRYEIFNDLADTLHFSKTAENLFLTQSAISQSIKALESSLSTQLFIRDKKKVTLTAQGELLYSYTKKALVLIQTAETLIAKENNLEIGELKISASDTITNFLLLEHLEYFTTLHPMVKIKLVNRTSEESVALLKSGKVDLAFANTPIFDSNLHIHPIFPIQDIFVGGEKFSHLKEKTLSLEELLSYPIISLEGSSTGRKFMDKFFLDQGFSFTPDIQLSSHDLLLSFAKNNIGISHVTKEFSAPNLERQEVFQLKTSFTIPHRHLVVCTLKNFHHTPACQLFLTQLQEKPYYYQ